MEKKKKKKKNYFFHFAFANLCKIILKSFFDLFILPTDYVPGIDVENEEERLSGKGIDGGGGESEKKIQFKCCQMRFAWMILTMC